MIKEIFKNTLKRTFIDLLPLILSYLIILICNFYEIQFNQEINKFITIILPISFLVLNLTLTILEQMILKKEKEKNNIK